MIKNQRVLLDSNILVYSSNKLSSKYKQAYDFRKLAKDGYFNPYIADQNILETIRVLTHPVYKNPMSNVTVLKQINSFASFCHIIHPKSETINIAIELIKKYQLTGNRVFDGYLIATVLSYNLRIIATDNEKHLSMFKEILVYNPFRSKQLN